MFKKIVEHKLGLLILVAFLLGIIVLANTFNKRWDLTKEKRYSLSEHSKNVLKNIKEPVEIEVFLKGQFPAGFKRLAIATKEFLDECKSYSGGKLNILFTEPLAKLDDSTARYFTDSLSYFYSINATMVGDLQTKAGEEQKSKLVLPGALVKANGKIAGVNLFQGTHQMGTEEEELAALYNQVEAGLEYKFIDAISKVNNTSFPGIAYALGHGQPFGPVVDGIYRNLLSRSKATNFFNFDTFNIANNPYIPESISTLIINKPSKPFTEYDKLKIDQYIMRGGTVFWAIDNMYAEVDSLLRSGNQGFVAFDRGLNLDDLLFTYGARINQNLLQDLNADRLPLLSGSQNEGQQSQLVPFSFMPILSGANHPITKNLDGVRSIFPNTLDTVNGSNGVKKTVLLKSSNHARIIGTPYKVDFSFLQYADDKNQFKVKDTSVAALLEGKFKSFFENKLSLAFADSLKKINRPFIETGEKEGKMIVVADGDIALNFVSSERGPLQMGENNYSRITYANRDFFMNSMAYLSGNGNLLQTRGKDFTLRFLDPVKKESKANQWQFVTTLLPILLIMIIGFVFGQIRKRKYTR